MKEEENKQRFALKAVKNFERVWSQKIAWVNYFITNNPLNRVPRCFTRLHNRYSKLSGLTVLIVLTFAVSPT